MSEACDDYFTCDVSFDPNLCAEDKVSFWNPLIESHKLLDIGTGFHTSNVLGNGDIFWEVGNIFSEQFDFQVFFFYY